MTDRPETAPQARVLVVDDEQEFRDTLAKVLQRRGLEVATVADGAAALAWLETAPADVVVLDLKMPGLDGLATLRAIQARPDPPQVVLLTGHGSVSAGIEALGLSAFDFLLKPFPADRLVDVILAAHQQRGERARD